MPFNTRTELLLGPTVVRAIADSRIIVFGTGGVGSWCAESLVRTGVRRLTVVDGDVVAQSNINRQVMALHSTVGQDKTAAMKERLTDINPQADITAIQRFYTSSTADTFRLDDYDYVVDCIDSLADKTLLLLRAAATPARVFSSMGAACKLDPQRIRVAELWKVKGCPLGAALRKRIRRTGEMPKKTVTCVYSEELHPNNGITEQQTNADDRVNGTVVHTTAVFGFTLAALIIKDIIDNIDNGA